MKLGKILIIIGPESSGKSTLTYKMLKEIPECFTIRRKEIINRVVNSYTIVNKYFKEDIYQAECIIGHKIQTLSELYDALSLQSLEQAQRLQIQKIVNKVINKHKNEDFIVDIVFMIYREYFQEIIPIIMTGSNVILDDSIEIDLFIKSTQGYPYVKFALLKTGLKKTFKNRLNRNNKFKVLVAECENFIEASRIVKQRELSNGTSSETYRFPNLHKLIKAVIDWFDSGDNSRIMAEWKIWVRCLGKVILINGTSSSGKTTLSNYLRNFGFSSIDIDDMWYESYYDNILNSNYNKDFTEALIFIKNLLSNSDMIKFLEGFDIKEAQYDVATINIIKHVQKHLQIIREHIKMPSYLEVLYKIYSKAKESIWSGRNTVIEVIINDDSYFDSLERVFGGYPLVIGLLYSSLKDSLNKCYLRNYKFTKNLGSDYRYPSQVMWQYATFYKFISKGNICSKDATLDIINSESIKEIIEQAKLEEQKLLNVLQERGVNEMIKYDSSTMLKNALTEIEKVVKPDICEDIVVTPATRYNFTMKSLFFSNMNNIRPAIEPHGDVDNINQTLQKKLMI